MFSTFPDGWSGLGLLLLRAVVGGMLTIRAVEFLSLWHDPKMALLASFFVVIGGLIIVGYHTRVLGVASAAAIVAGILFSSTGQSHHLLDIRTGLVLASVIAVAVACLGPGAFSVDSRLFGHREIVIPKTPHKTGSNLN
jgi:hypothetical protein